MIKNVKQSWLNGILHLSGFIYKLKRKMINGGVWMTIFLGIIILLLEILLMLVSLPFYIFYFQLNRTGHSFEGGVKAYRLRRKVTLLLFFSLFLFSVFYLMIYYLSFS